ncbi:MAG: tRNA pseudouridine(55) synthase TruB [Intestinimonas sp.]|nr:tRNA pseudouridine(55) synthase TruB [Intestinimonas sp.]
MATGIIVIDKPADWTSHDVVAKLRGIFHEKRVGHAGTLDPMATGVLPVFVGRATRAVEFAAEAGKEYVAGLRLGVVTDTQDVTGTILSHAPVSVTDGQMRDTIEKFKGEIQQIPPMYSAVKIKGKKLYELARKGREVERAPRAVTIYELELLERVGQTDFMLRVACSKGTYIRTLCYDIGRMLGCGGTMYTLRRTRAAGFCLNQAMTLEQVQQAADEGRAESLLLPVDAYFARYPSLTVGEGEVRSIRNGAAFVWAGQDGTYRVYGPDGTFLMLGRLVCGEMITIKSFFTV